MHDGLTKHLRYLNSDNCLINFFVKKLNKGSESRASERGNENLKIQNLLLCFQESLDKMECCATKVWHFTPWVFFGIAPFLMLCQPFSSFWIGHFHTRGFDLFLS
jgi:hypothetical protein